MKIARRSLQYIFIAGLATLAGCHQQGPQPSKDVQSEAARTFGSVAEHLDTGGDVYVYIRSEEVLPKLPAALDSWRDPLWSSVEDSLSREEFDSWFDFGKYLLNESGITQLRAVGYSAAGLENGLTRLRTFLYTGELEKPGFLWSLSGESDGPHKLGALDFLPDTTMYTGFTDFSPLAFWNFILETSKRFPDKAVQAQAEAVPDQLQQVLGMPVDQVLASLDDEFGFVVTGEEDAKMSIPVTEPPLETPELALAILIKVKDDTLYNLLVSKLNQALPPKMAPKASENGGVRMNTVTIPQMPYPVAPTVARFGDYLAIATNQAIVEKLARVGENLPPLLKDSEEFKALAGSESLEGYGFSYISERAAALMAKINELSTTEADMPPALKAKLDEAYARFAAKPSLGISRNLPNGVESVVMTTFSADDMVASLAAVPALFAIGIASEQSSGEASEADSSMSEEELQDMLDQEAASDLPSSLSTQPPGQEPATESDAASAPVESEPQSSPEQN